MRIAKEQIPVKIDVPGAVARQAVDFGDTTSYSTLGGEYLSLGAGTDIAPLLQGLHENACHAPHWGYVISGRVIASYADGSEDVCSGGDLFHWPAGHSVRVTKDAEVIMFSPQLEHSEVMSHMLANLTD